MKGEYYFGNLEDLYNKHYVGLEHTWKQPSFALTSKFKYFNAKDDGNTFDIDAQNIGLLETVKVKPYFWFGLPTNYWRVGLPITRWLLPETYFINWNATGFFKEDEKSYHVMYGYDFKDYIPGLNAMVKYVYGHDFKAANGEKTTKLSPMSF